MNESWPNRLDQLRMMILGAETMADSNEMRNAEAYYTGTCYRHDIAEQLRALYIWVRRLPRGNV